MTKVIMNGCNGKMGQTITEICKADADIEIVAGIDLYDGIDNDYPVFSSIDKCDVDADVVIDFSNAKAVDGVLDYCVDKQVPVVLCTTGLSDEQLAKVEECYKKVAVLKSANMSLGINTLMALLKKAAQVFAPACCVSRYTTSNCLNVVNTVISTEGAIIGRIAGIVIKYARWNQFAPSRIALS